MRKNILLVLLALYCNTSWSETQRTDLQVDVKRNAGVYSFDTHFDTPLSRCAAYHFLTDYEAATNLPGVIESKANRIAANQVRVEQIAVESVLFMHFRLHSVLEYTENPSEDISFVQLSGDSKKFQGHWHITPNTHGSTLTFHGVWEPDTVLPLFIVDHFAKNGLVDRFGAIAELAKQRNEVLSAQCSTTASLVIQKP